MNMKSIVLIVLSLVLILSLADCFDYQETDLASDESLWDLYERWRSYHRISSDLTNHEFVCLYAGSKVAHHRMLHGPRKQTGFVHQNSTLPPSVDWRLKGVVTDVKNQGQCGSCWAFSTVVAVEGINKIKTGKLVSLSEQELVDCDKDNSGCNGGFMENAFAFIKSNGGITTESLYPYQAKDESCDRKKTNGSVVIIDGYENVPVNNEDDLMKAAANQPVSVAIDAGGSDFQLFSEGVFTGPCGTGLNHGVAVVGYGTTVEGTKYWLVKNSWGEGWGEKGYIRMQRGFKEKEGLCGIAMDASYPIKLASDNDRKSKCAAFTSSKEELRIINHVSTC